MDKVEKKIRMLVHTHVGAATMIAVMEGKITDGVMHLKDKLANEIIKLYKNNK